MKIPLEMITPQYYSETGYRFGKHVTAFYIRTEEWKILSRVPRKLQRTRNCLKLAFSFLFSSQIFQTDQSFASIGLVCKLVISKEMIKLLLCTYQWIKFAILVAVNMTLVFCSSISPTFFVEEINTKFCCL